MRAPHLLSFLLLAATTVPAAQPSPSPLPAQTPAAFDASSTAWIDLLEEGGLAAWQREHYPARRPMGETNPWSYDRSTGVLRCEATGIHEMLLHRTPRGNGIFRVEFRYIGSAAKPNSGVFVRTAPDASVWYQAQLAPSGLGMLFGQMPSPGAPKPMRLSVGNRHPQLLRPAGDWNELEITCRGPELTLWINGHVVAHTDACPTPLGNVGLEAEFNPIEFRNLKFKPLP